MHCRIRKDLGNQVICPELMSGQRRKVYFVPPRIGETQIAMVLVPDAGRSECREWYCSLLKTEARMSVVRRT